MKKTHLIGREKEVALLEKLLHTEESELVSVIGRRRVGKTFLIQHVYHQQLAFEITGIQHASLKEQLENFSIALQLFAKTTLPVETPKSWLDAFRLLILYLEQLNASEKKVVFFDEMPWLSTHRSGFLKAFGFFWNSWAVKNNVIVVICGSAASWMIRKVVHNKGGLFNRITKRIYLFPFTLYETELYLRHKGIKFNRHQITALYMVLGGIPHYLKEVQNGESVAQNIDRICFTPSSMLYDEFEQLYPSLFDHAENHQAIVRALSSKQSGLTRSEIITLTKLSNGGGVSTILEELTHSGFIGQYPAFGHAKRATRYRLTDEYSLFYLKFIEPLKKEGAGTWVNFQSTPSYKSWSGYAFESVCLKHIAEIKKALGIAGVFARSSSYYQKGNQDTEGFQIDLLIDRDDRVINLCEIKWSNTEFIISKSYAADLRRKVALFQHHSGTKKQVFLTFLSTYGILPNEHSANLVDKSIVLDDLFEK
ncbi:MAG TPA: ATP-binding protein [Saprospiraceae bacterium]|nr:ATP-binding protein [Saprospiraceae bacterium]HMQ84226.1 ATP-binding protein [Saprospiraceae bacterium]